MSTIEVTSWAEIAAACAAVATNQSTTIKLMNDIDMNDEASEGVGLSISSSWWSYTFTIDGGYTDEITGEKKRYKIKNLRTPISGTANLFYFYYDTAYPTSNAIYVKFKDIDFQNIILASGNFVSWSSNTLLGFSLTIENCRFVGTRSKWYLSDRNTGIVLNKSYFNIPWNGGGETDLSYTSLIPKDDNNATNVSANYCRFKEAYGNWVYATGGYGIYPTFRPFSFSYIKCSGCRMEGSMTIPWFPDTTVGQDNVYMCAFFAKPIASYSPSTQNVFDVSLVCDDIGVTSSVQKVVCCSSFSYLVKKSAVCRSDGSECTYTTQGAAKIDGNNYPLPFMATPTEMTEPAFLAANGFNIIVPTE